MNLTALELAQQSIVSAMIFGKYEDHGGKIHQLIYLHESDEATRDAMMRGARAGLRFVGFCGWTGEEVLTMCPEKHPDTLELFGAGVLLFTTQLLELARSHKLQLLKG